MYLIRLQSNLPVKDGPWDYVQDLDEAIRKADHRSQRTGRVWEVWELPVLPEGQVVAYNLPLVLVYSPEAVAQAESEGGA